jgi:hypothetical protein
MFARGMFAGNRVGGVYGADTRCAMIRQSGAVTRQCGAARTGCCGVTAQAATRAVATTTTTARVATSASASATTPRVAAAPAARGDAR